MAAIANAAQEIEPKRMFDDIPRVNSEPEVKTVA
jgi:hypothetical protein